MFFNNTVYFISGNETDLKYLIGFLNSSLINWYYKTLSVQLGENAVRMFSIYVEKIPIIKPNLSDRVSQQIDGLISNIINLKKNESFLNKLIYELYNLTDEEVEFIEVQ